MSFTEKPFRPLETVLNTEVEKEGRAVIASISQKLEKDAIGIGRRQEIDDEGNIQVIENEAKCDAANFDRAAITRDDTSDDEKCIEFILCNGPGSVYEAEHYHSKATVCDYGEYESPQHNMFFEILTKVHITKISRLGNVADL